MNKRWPYNSKQWIACIIDIEVHLLCVFSVLFVTKRYISAYTLYFLETTIIGLDFAADNIGLSLMIFLPRDASAERGDATVSCPSVRL